MDVGQKTGRRYKGEEATGKQSGEEKRRRRNLERDWLEEASTDVSLQIQQKLNFRGPSLDEPSSRHFTFNVCPLPPLSLHRELLNQTTIICNQATESTSYLLCNRETPSAVAATTALNSLPISSTSEGIVTPSTPSRHPNTTASLIVTGAPSPFQIRELVAFRSHTSAIRESSAPPVSSPRLPLAVTSASEPPQLCTVTSTVGLHCCSNPSSSLNRRTSSSSPSPPLAGISFSSQTTKSPPSISQSHL
ncbi:uncharacterized protein HKW66_Vig0149760 [Vigna angularis]|uniref:Uncharacterized protein n=1 Tax=Phaseolus angularis TaxID=3914 RepID=A0A8T0JXB9_PHAAN|nr:uncharacterized protein HKW66_Vig0149760 [Vigna angularis]